MGTSLVTNDFISQISGYSVSSLLQIGSNGSDEDSPEYAVGVSDYDLATGTKVWDSSPVGSIDSGDVNVGLTVGPGGGYQAVGWTVSGGGTVPLYCSNATYGNLSSVQLRAMVVVNGAKMAWKDMVFRFYKNGNLIQTITYSTVVADTSQSSAEVEEQILTVTPSASDNTQVVIDGKVQLTLNTTDIPVPEATCGQIYIF